MGDLKRQHDQGAGDLDSKRAKSTPKDFQQKLAEKQAQEEKIRARRERLASWKKKMEEKKKQAENKLQSGTEADAAAPSTQDREDKQPSPGTSNSTVKSAKVTLKAKVHRSSPSPQLFFVARPPLCLCQTHTHTCTNAHMRAFGAWQCDLTTPLFLTFWFVVFFWGGGV